jgi:hypothetical protein
VFAKDGLLSLLGGSRNRADYSRNARLPAVQPAVSLLALPTLQATRNNAADFCWHDLWPPSRTASSRIFCGSCRGYTQSTDTRKCWILALEVSAETFNEKKLKHFRISVRKYEKEPVRRQKSKLAAVKASRSTVNKHLFSGSCSVLLKFSSTQRFFKCALLRHNLTTSIHVALHHIGYFVQCNKLHRISSTTLR